MVPFPDKWGTGFVYACSRQFGYLPVSTVPRVNSVVTVDVAGTKRCNTHRAFI